MRWLLALVLAVGSLALAQEPPPVSQDPPEDQQFVLRSAERFRRRGDDVEAEGDVRFGFRGYDVVCRRAVGNLETEQFSLEGAVQVVGKGQTIRAERVEINFKDESFDFSEGDVQLSPEYVGGNLRRDLFVRAESGGGTERRVECAICGLTTCDREHRHFEFRARSTEVLPGKRAILRDTDVYILGRRILRVPYLVIPLEKGAERYVPEVGQSPDEGYYVKTKFTTPLKGEDNFLDTRLDYFTKLGNGFGLDYALAVAGVKGLYKVYGLTGSTKTFTASANHRQRAFGGDLTIDANLNKSNYLTAPDSTTTSVRGSFVLPDRRGGSTRLSFFRTGAETTSFRTSNQAYGLSDTRRIGSVSTSLDLNLSENRLSSGPSGDLRRSQLDLRFRGTQEFRFASASLEYDRSIPVGANENFFSSNDRTPMVSLRSDAGRLFGARFARTFPFAAELSVGEVVDPRERSRLTRTHFDFQFNQATPSRQRLTLQTTGRFRQGIYSDDTAQYVLGLDANLGYRIGRDSSFNLRYGYLRPYGFTPLLSDQSGRVHVLGASLALKPGRGFTFSAESGYDFLRLQESLTPWQTVGLRGEYRPHDRLRITATSNYDTFRQVWGNARMDVGWRVSGGFLAAGFRFDGERHTFGAVNLLVSDIRWGKLTTSVLLNYNGYKKQFEARHFQFVYDLHCVDAILEVIDNPVGFRSGRQIAFFIRLKALPFGTPFGIGRRGQAIGSGSGGFGR